jgi:polyisoprenoid-binding protein YceI
MRPTSRRLTLTWLALALAACGAPPTPTAPPSAPPPAPAAATSAPAPTAPPPPTAAPPAPTVAPPTATAAPPTATPMPPTATPAPARRFAVQKDSKLTLTVNEQFANVPLPNDAVLTTGAGAVTGQLSIGADGRFSPDSKVTVDLSTLESDDPDRDVNIKDNYLETKTHRDGVFVPKELRGLPSPAPASGPIKGQLIGDLTIHGVTKPITFQVDGTLDGGTFKGTAKTEVKITDFGMKVPTLAILLSVEDRVRTQLDLVATEQR